MYIIINVNIHIKECMYYYKEIKIGNAIVFKFRVKQFYIFHTL